MEGTRVGENVVIGTTSYAFRYSFLDPARAPPLLPFLEEVRTLGIGRLQICENVRPLEISSEDWKNILQKSAEIGLDLQIGCKTSDVAVFLRYLALAKTISGSHMIRLVFEEESGEPPSAENLKAFLDRIVPALRETGFRLAIENHFDIPCKVLADVVEPYPADVVGFCVDTANSLRNFESEQVVMALLSPRAYCYHMKDYAVEGTKIGFRVFGAPLGRGRLQTRWCVEEARNQGGDIFIETWTEEEGSHDANVLADRRWLKESYLFMRSLLTW